MLIEVKDKIQQEGRQAWFDNFCKGTLAWATGVGKSKAAIDIMEQFRHEYLQAKAEGICQILLVSPTEEMRDNDWPAEFEKWGVSMQGIKGVCYASLAKEDLSKYDLIVYDECHRLTVHNLQRQQQVNKPALGLTATFPKARFEDDLERISLLTELLPPVHKVSTDEAVELGLISDFEIMTLMFYLDSVNKNIPGGTKKKPFMTTEKAAYNYYSQCIRTAVIKNIEPLKFSAISKRTRFLYNLPSKFRLAQQCLEQLKKEEKRTLVFAGSIEQANALCGEQVYHSESDSNALQRFQNKEIDLLGAVRALNEGKNLTEPDQCLVVQVDSVERNLVQRIGRIIRKRYDNPDFKARIVILVAMGTADEQWYKMSIKDFDTVRIKEYLVRVPDIQKSVKCG